MAFKIDFKKLNEERLANMTPEQREYENTYKNLIKENEFYKTTTTLVHEKYNKEIEESQIEVKLYKRVNYQTLEVDNKLLLQFYSSPWEYAFDNQFYNRMMKQLADSNNTNEYGLCVDAGGRFYILKEECVRILEEVKLELINRNIDMVEDYYPCCTKMLKEMI